MSDHPQDGTPHPPADPPPAPRRATGRAFALIGAADGERRVTHTTGYPLNPADLLPDADVVLLIADAGSDDGPGAMLFRYSAYGEVGGDTWHPSADDARAQAAAEYGAALQAWEAVPPEVVDAHAFAVRCAAERLNDREGR